MTRTCTRPSCNKPHAARGYCNLHYNEARRHGEFEAGQPDRLCDVDSCGRPHSARGYCVTHYQQWKRTGGEPPQALHFKEIAYLRGLVGIPATGPTPEQRLRWRREDNELLQEAS